MFGNTKKNITSGLKEISKLAQEKNIVLTPCRYSLAAALLQYGKNLEYSFILDMVKNYTSNNTKIKQDAEAYYADYVASIVA